jgi:putative restriction endonuclease
MRIFVGITDRDWFDLLSSQTGIEEVNFWRPSPSATFKALTPGELFLFKLHAPDNYIVGGGFFARFQQMPVNLAWEVFGLTNGVRTLNEMRNRIAYYRREPMAQHENPQIGCILLAEPFFWPRELWITSPSDFASQIVSGKGYDAETGGGQRLWAEVEQRLQAQAMREAPATEAAIATHGYGKPQIILPRLGQGLFRVVVTDAYDRRCALTGERTLPVLDAAHIRPFYLHQRHEVSNGLLMRSDLHRLFDGGYITVDPADRKIVVSQRIKEEFSNGKEYYRLHGQPIREPEFVAYRPTTENLEYHAYEIFR